MTLDTDTLFRMLADETRRRVLLLLAAEGELCVCELTHALGLSQPKISRHLAHLREAELLLTRRVGQWMYYRIDPRQPDWAQAILLQMLDGNRHAAPYAADHARMKDMPNRPGASCCA